MHLQLGFMSFCSLQGCMFRPGLNECKDRRGMTEAEYLKEKWEREFESWKKAKWAERKEQEGIKEEGGLEESWDSVQSHGLMLQWCLIISGD